MDTLPQPLEVAPVTTRLTLVRHAEVEEKYQGVFGGRIDMNLSERGRRQAQALAGYLEHRKFDAIYSSPMKRVQQTLAPVRVNSCPAPTVAEGLREVDFGVWTGHTWGEVQKKFGFSAFQWLEQLEAAGIPEAECSRTFRKRVEPVVKEVIAKHKGGNVAVFCHGGVIRMILSILLKLPFPATGAFDIEYAGLTRVALMPHKTEIEMMNFVPWRDL